MLGGELLQQRAAAPFPLPTDREHLIGDEPRTARFGIPTVTVKMRDPCPSFKQFQSCRHPRPFILAGPSVTNNMPAPCHSDSSRHLMP